MNANVRRFDRSNLTVIFVLLLSVSYLALLAASIHAGVFYSGDGGVKYMMIKQLSEGHGFRYVHLPQPSWVQSIWQAGYFPLRPPFVYSSPAGYMFVFPPLYQLVNAFLYSRLGFAGMYILPVLCTVLLWWWMIVLLRRCGIAPYKIAAALFLMVFCSPLAVYGAIYWEHASAALLLFAGVVYIAQTPRQIWGAIGLGLLSGLAIWLRPEAIMLDFLYALAALALYRRERNALHLVFAACLLASALAFVTFNKLEYGSVLGLHATQLTDPNDPDNRLTVAKVLHNLWSTNYRSIRHFGFILLLIPIGYRLWRSGGKGDPRPALLVLIALLFSVLTPLFLPNDGGRQWGARYFLPLIPLVIVILCLIDQRWGIWKGGLQAPAWLAAFFVLVGAYSLYHNTYKGGVEDVRWSISSRVAPYLKQLQQGGDGKVVIVAHQYMAYEFSYLFDRDYFFLASGDDSLRRLLPLLKANGVHEYTYIFNPRDPSSQPPSLRDSTTRYLWPLAAQRKVKEEFYCTKNTIE